MTSVGMREEDCSMLLQAEEEIVGKMPEEADVTGTEKGQDLTQHFRKVSTKTNKTSKIRIPARMLVPFDQNSQNSQINSQQPSQARLQVPIYQKMRREIKRLKNTVSKLKNEKCESDEKARRYLAQSTLTSYGIKCLKNWSGGVSPKLLNDISQQLANTFYTPVIIKKKQMKNQSNQDKSLSPITFSPSGSSFYKFHQLTSDKV